MVCFVNFQSENLSSKSVVHNLGYEQNKTQNILNFLRLSTFFDLT